jgi:hypothetical protein
LDAVVKVLAEFSAAVDVLGFVSFRFWGWIDFLEEVEVLVESILEDLGELIEQFGINFEDVDKLFAVFGL